MLFNPAFTAGLQGFNIVLIWKLQKNSFNNVK